MHTFFDNKQIDVAVAVHLAAGGGPEKDDFLRLSHFDNASDDFIQDLGVEYPFVHAVSPASAGRLHPFSARNRRAGSLPAFPNFHLPVELVNTQITHSEDFGRPLQITATASRAISSQSGSGAGRSLQAIDMAPSSTTSVPRQSSSSAAGRGCSPM